MYMLYNYMPSAQPDKICEKKFWHILHVVCKNQCLNYRNNLFINIEGINTLKKSAKCITFLGDVS